MITAMYEHHSQPLLPRAQFVRRQIGHAAVALGIVGGSLALGVLGYHTFEGFSWVDSLLNASMILGGMGPIGELHTTAGKLFASFYALYSGMILLVAVSVLFAPIFHRYMHMFHLDAGEDASDDEAGPVEKSGQ